MKKNLSIGKMILGSIAIIIALVFVFTIGKLGEDVKNNQIVVNQYPFSGRMEFWTTPGFRWQWYGKTTEYFKTNQVWFNEIVQGDEGDLSIEGKDNPAFPITYSDKGKGFVLGSVRVELPVERELLNRIQSHYGSERRLIDELVKPTLGKVILACGPLMTSLDLAAPCLPSSSICMVF